MDCFHLAPKSRTKTEGDSSRAAEMTGVCGPHSPPREYFVRLIQSL